MGGPSDFEVVAVKALSKATTDSPSYDEVFLRVHRHNLREIPAEIGIGKEWNIDPDRIHLNERLAGPGTAQEVLELAQLLCREAGIEWPEGLRSNASLGIEAVFPLPRDTQIDRCAYFSDAMRWVIEYYGVPVLSAVIHNDQTHPHMHVVLLGLRDGGLSADKVMGKKKSIYAMRTAFHEEVGKRYGLRKARKHLGAAVRAQCASDAVGAIKQHPGLLDEPEVCRALHDLIAKADNPESLVTALGLTMPKRSRKPPRAKTSTGIFISKVKPNKPTRTTGNT